MNITLLLFNLALSLGASWVKMNRISLKEIFENKHIGSGVALFSFTDGWWKAGNNHQQDPGGWAPNSSGVPYDGSPNEEYWGIVDIDRNKKETFEAVLT